MLLAPAATAFAASPGAPTIAGCADSRDRRKLAAARHPRPDRMSPTRNRNLRRLLHPQTIAFVGGGGLADTIRQSARFGFSGDLWVVNPRREEIAGHRCFAAVDDLPAPPDAAFVGVSREAAVAVVRALAARGGGGCVCYAAGFAEAGADGAALERALVEAAGDMALVGPNCYGLLNYFDGVALFPAPYGGARPRRGVAIVSQSGNVSLNLTMNARSLPLGFVISAGNQAVTELGDYVEGLVDDSRVSAIGLYVEGLKDVGRFARAARAALEKGVPIVALKVGASQAGERLTFGHTGSLSGPEALHRALFRRLSIPLVRSLPELVESLKLLHVLGPLAGRRLAVLAASGGDATLVADLAEREGFTLPPPSDDQVGALRGLLAPFAPIANPLDYNNPLWGDRDGMEACFATVMSGEVDLTILVLDYPHEGMAAREQWDDAIDAFIAAQARSGGRAAVVSTLPETFPESVRERLMAAGIAPLQGLDGLAAALRCAARYGEDRVAALRAPAVAPSPAATPPGNDTAAIDEWTAKRKLADWGLSVPAGRLVAPADAPAAAEALGFPVAAKAIAGGLVHKSEAGAVRLGLASGTAVGAAVAGFPGREVLVERMVEDVVAELIVGIRRDPRFGFALLLGSGGVHVDIAGDNVTLLLPACGGEIEAALARLRVGRLLNGFRGRPAGDRGAAVEAVLALAAFAERHRERLLELEVNPLAVLGEGRGAVVLDAAMRLAEG